MALKAHTRARVRPAELLALLCALGLALPVAAGAHTGAAIGEYAHPTMNGQIGPDEYEGSCIPPSTQTAGSTTYTIEICEANDETNDYWAVRINDLTLDVGNANDSPLVWFDNNHDGVVEPGVGNNCAPYGGAVEDYIGSSFGIFADAYYCYSSGSMYVGFADGGPWNGVLADDFTPGTGWVFEFSHPLDSADFDDYSVSTGDTAGWCFTYDDQSNPTNSFAFGELQYPPACWVDPASQNDAVNGATTIYADVYKESKAHDIVEGILAKLKDLVDSCIPCPPDPDPRAKLLEKIRTVIQALRNERTRAATAALKQFIGSTKGFIRSGELAEKGGKRFVRIAVGFLEQLESPDPPSGPSVEGYGAQPGAARPGTTSQVNANGAFPPGAPPSPPSPRPRRD